MASETVERTGKSDVNDTPLRAIVDTPLTDSLVNRIFQLQNNDGSLPATAQLGELFHVDFERIKRDLNSKGLDPSIADEILRLISTASVLFYFLYHSQKTDFPVDINAIKQFVSKARAELDTFSSKDDPIMQTYIDKGELAVTYVIQMREKHADVCRQIQLSQATWESYVQYLMGLDKE